MDTVVNRMIRVPADAYKVVTTARKPSDNVRVLAAARIFPRHSLVVLAMGELGFPTRVLSPVFGGVYTYAAPGCAEGTAAGQVGAHQLRRLYRVEKLRKASKIYGVIADPIRHSISPAVHNRAFQLRRIDAVYLPFLVSPAHLRDFFSSRRRMPLAGFSVTIPHKQKIIRYLDVVDPLARRIGAVNTVWRKAGKWRGANTDVAGVTGPLARVLRLRNASILMVGNGGAARGAAFALADAGAKITLTGRNFDRVRSLAKVCGADGVARRSRFARTISTPWCMPRPWACIRTWAGVSSTAKYRRTWSSTWSIIRLRRNCSSRAREQGKTVVPGIDMFIEQAVRQFEIWTGETAPRAAMLKAAQEALEPRCK